MDDIDHIIKEIVRRFFQEEGHTKISARTIAKKGQIPIRVVSAHISRHDLELCWEKRDKGIIILNKGMK
jgi:hypothetical protein